MLKTVYGHLLCEIRPEKKEKKKKDRGDLEIIVAIRVVQT
jgi:hypothetical protein